MADRSVLIVEDDVSIRHVLREALKDEGYEVREASHGQAAIEMLSDWRPDVMVLDLMMPAMDGWAFRKQQRALNRAMDVPIVLLSASRAIDDAEELGPAAIVEKPFDLDDLLSVITSLLGR